MSSSMASPSPSPSPSSPKLCFNSNCKEVLERSRRGWRRRTGGYADLCDRCASVFEEGNFCESFHLNASGWRCCESCGKQIHCGCIVSFHMFVLLDAGGIECITCARKSFILTPNPAWPPSSRILPELPDRIKDLSVKNWSSIAGSGPLPWRQAPSSFNNSTAQSELNPKMPFEVDIPGGIDRLLSSERFYTSSLDKKKTGDSLERLMNGCLKTGALQIFENGTSGSKCEEQLNPYVNVTQQSTFSNNEPSIPHFSSTLNHASKTETTEQTKAGTHAQRVIPPPAAVKQFSSPNGVDSCGEAQTRSGRPRGDSRGRNQLLPRYWPRITDHELQQISGDSNYVITPLFEKMLSASDAGRIGRLVLPKKCAEAYFPTISNPEGIPLTVQDLKGKEWVFQFRFWPNNNSRMYVLEGVTPCIQSMQLQAGDTVTFSRLEPEGKLVMGCRKASAPPPDQNKESINIGNGVSTHGDASIKAIKPGEVVSVHRHSKGNSVSSLLAINQANSADPASTWSEVDKSMYIAREVPGAKPVFRSKRKNSTLGSKSKRLRIENEDMMELKLTWEEAQGLFRPPPNHVPRIVVIEGYEFEEFEEPPIIGRPTVLAIDHVGGKIQWAQCEDCLKWRKVPSDVLFPSRWTCSENLWDPERSLCSAAEELLQEELEDLLSTGNQAGAKKIKVDKEEFDSLEALEGLDALANLAILEEGDALPSSSQATTKHPRHRPGCTCIVCIQPPSGKGPKHKQTCTCNVCLTVKRRFRTLMLRREQKQSEKDAETARQKLQQPEQLAGEDILLCSDTGNCSPNHKMVINEVSDDDPNKRESCASPFKVQIDLNIQPEREEDLSPISDSGGVMRLLEDATERYLKQQKISSSVGNSNSVVSQMHPAGVQVGNLSNIVTPLDSSHQNGDSGHPLTFSATKS